MCIIKQTTTKRFPRVQVDIPFLRDSLSSPSFSLVGGAPAIDDDGKVNVDEFWMKKKMNTSFFSFEKKETKKRNDKMSVHSSKKSQ